ncbi:MULTISPECIES: lipase family protein [Streptomyces]|uniref:Lipase family protein n=1 Tax=Streptomyces achmelvichensis TaxID=3134111 RepID=A0ACC6PZ29_9ACTN|nr:lipase family protein [Streptomyces sp. NBC_01167]
MRVPTRVLAVMAALALSAATPTASADDTSAAGPGDIVGSAPSAFHPLPGQPTATRAWRITYRSTTADGAPNTVSGTVIVPQDGRTGPRPLVTYAVGTVGLADSCAPSAGFPTGTTVEANLIQQLTLRGWAVAVTDYEGLGTPGEHTYTVGRSAGHAVLDAARAAIALPEAGLSADSPVGIMGYSQGGQASSWAAELHDSYAPELKVRGTVTGGVPARLTGLAPVHDGSYGSGLLFMAAAGQDAAFPELKLDSYLNPAGRALISFLRNNCVALDTTVGSFKKISDMTVRNPLETPQWQKRLHESDLGSHRPGHPVYLYHALADELIPYGQGSQLRKDWCAKGANVKWRTIVLGEHVTGVITEAIPAANWLADRFAGRAAAGNC